jgi:hypothetical protein
MISVDRLTDGTAAILGDPIASAHGLEHAVRRRLDRQVKLGADGLVRCHHGRGVGGEEGRMAGGEPETGQTRHAGHGLQQVVKGLAPVAIGVDGLPQELQLQGTLTHAPPGLGHDLREGPMHLPAPGSRDDAEGAAHVAAFHDGDERLPSRPGGLASVPEDGGEIVQGGVHRGPAGPGLAHQARQAPDSPRPQDQVDVRGAPEDLLALLLGHAAGHPDHGLGRVRLEMLDPAQEVEQLLGRLLPDRTGVQEDHVGLGGSRRRPVTLGFQQGRHLLLVLGVHLTAPGLDVVLAVPVGHEDGPGNWPANRRARLS